MSNYKQNLCQLFAELDKAKNVAKAAKSPFYLKVETAIEAAKEEAKIAHRQEKDERSKLMIERREFEIKESEFSDSKYVGGRVSTQIYYKMTKNRDLFWDICDRDQGKHHPSNWAPHGTHGSKGQRKNKVQTKQFNQARKAKYWVDPDFMDEDPIELESSLHVNVGYTHNDNVENTILQPMWRYKGKIDDISIEAEKQLKELNDKLYCCNEIHLYVDANAGTTILAVIKAAKKLCDEVYIHAIQYYPDGYTYSPEETIQKV